VGFVVLPDTPQNHRKSVADKHVEVVAVLLAVFRHDGRVQLRFSRRIDLRLRQQRTSPECEPGGQVGVLNR